MTMTLIAICLTIPNWVAERQYKTKIKTEIKTCNFLRGVSFLFFLRLHLSFVFYSSKCVVCIQNSCTIYQRVGITNNMILTKYLTNCDTNKFLHCFFPISFAFSFILSRIWKETQFIVLSSLARALSLSLSRFSYFCMICIFFLLFCYCVLWVRLFETCVLGGWEWKYVVEQPLAVVPSKYKTLIREPFSLCYIYIIHPILPSILLLN